MGNIKSKQSAYIRRKGGALFDSPHPPLVYEKLLQNEIRVARCRFVDESTFTIILQKLNFVNAPDFDALSYT
jgi:hypothetical protein